MKKLCFEVLTLAYPVRLYQTGKNRFTVEYGKQSTHGKYRDAMEDLGGAIMHALQCEGKFDT